MDLWTSSKFPFSKCRSCRGPSKSQIIATAEGFTDTAEPNVVVFRDVDGKRSAAKFDVNEIRDGKSKDPQILQGDLIVVSDSAVKSAYQGLLKVLPVSSLFVALL